MNDKPRYVEVEGEVGLWRESASQGIVATDEAYSRYKAERDKRLRELSSETRINKLESELKDVRAAVADIKSDVKELISLIKGTYGNSSS